MVQPIRARIRKSGFIEGRTIAIEFRWDYGDRARLPELAAELVRRRVSRGLLLEGDPSTIARIHVPIMPGAAG